jgi:hypothetical protein
MAYTKYIAILLVGIVIGFYLYDWFLAPEVKEKIVETIKIETRIDSVPYKEIVYVDRVKIVHRHIRDTVFSEPYKLRINRFSATFPMLYGNAYLSGEVLGEVLNTSLTTDFKLPQITNTITKEKTTTNTIIQKGIFVGGGANSDMQYHVGATYLGNKFLLEYNFQPRQGTDMTIPVHQAGLKIKLFK